MNRERDAYRQMRQDAAESINRGPVYEAKSVKPNYLSAIIWTSVVAVIVCSIFMGLLLFLVNESDIESNLENAASHAVYNLEKMVTQQNEELNSLREENKKIHDYLKLWTPIDPIDCRRRERWTIPGYGLPEVLPEVPKRYSYELTLCE